MIIKYFLYKLESEIKIMKIIFIIFMLLLFSCKNDQQKKTIEETISSATGTAVTKKQSIEPKKIEEEPLVTDTGQTWFKIIVTRNDSSYINYEGSWPVYLTTEGFATLAFTASKGALVISHGLTLYISGSSSGRMPIVRSEKKGEVSMTMIPEVNGAYSLPISPDTGFIEFTKNDGKVISGYFNAHSTNEYKDVYRFKGQFLNVKPH